MEAERQVSYRIVFDDNYLSKVQSLALAQHWATRLVYQSRLMWLGVIVIDIGGIIVFSVFHQTFGIVLFSGLLLGALISKFNSRRVFSKGRERNPLRGTTATVSVTTSGVELV